MSVSKHHRIWATASTIVVVLVVSGAVAGANYLNHQGELADPAGVRSEGATGPTLDQRMMGMHSYPTPSPSAYVPKEPETVMPPSSTPPSGPPAVSNRDVKGEPPLGASPGPGMPEDPRPGEQVPDPGLGVPASAAGIYLGQTTDEKGNSHALVLNVPDSARDAILHAAAGFAVISGSSTFSVTGDAAVDSWRFAVDSEAAGEGAPIVVIKNAVGKTTQDLAASPNTYTSASELAVTPFGGHLLIEDVQYGKAT